MADEDIPPILYKYISWNNEHHRKILTGNKIFFASPSKFNDPFDSIVNIRYDLNTDEEKIEHYKRILLQMFPNCEISKIKILAQEFHNNYPKVYNDSVFTANKGIVEMENGRLGIFSLSEINNDILMWAHYANSHSGACIGFYTNSLFLFLLQYFKTINVKIAYIKMKYQDLYPIIRSAESFEDQLKETLSTKSKHWEYEKESRFIIWGTSNIEVELPEGIMSEAILGCNISQKHKSEIIEHLKCKNTKIGLKQASKNANEFKLDFHDVNY